MEKGIKPEVKTETEIMSCCVCGEPIEVRYALNKLGKHCRFLGPVKGGWDKVNYWNQRVWHTECEQRYREMQRLDHNYFIYIPKSQYEINICLTAVIEVTDLGRCYEIKYYKEKESVYNHFHHDEFNDDGNLKVKLLDKSLILSLTTNVEVKKGEPLL